MNWLVLVPWDVLWNRFKCDVPKKLHRLIFIRVNYIYKITNLVNGKFYIGKTKNLQQRWWDHTSCVGRIRHPLYDSMLHHGIDSFVMEVVDQTDGDIDALERYWIGKTKAIELGYNITDGGTGGDVFSGKSDEQKEITRRKLREASIKNWQTDEYRTAVVVGLKEVWASKTDEELERFSLEIKDRWNTPEYRQKMSGHKLTEEHKRKVSYGVRQALSSPEMREKWSECKRGKKNGRWLGYLVATDLDGNRMVYESAKEASVQMGCTAQNLRNHATNGTSFVRGPYKGWIFEFSDTE